jgi:hypothetical protein
VAYKDDGFVVRENHTYFIEFLAKKGCGVWVWITAGVRIDPDLIIGTNDRVLAEGVDHGYPRGRRVKQSMDEKQGDEVFIVRT